MNGTTPLTPAELVQWERDTLDMIHQAIGRSVYLHDKPGRYVEQRTLAALISAMPSQLRRGLQLAGEQARADVARKSIEAFEDPGGGVSRARGSVGSRSDSRFWRSSRRSLQPFRGA